MEQSAPDMPDFTGQPAAYLEWAKENYAWNPQFCARHWMPCPVEGKPGLVASVMMMQITMSQMPMDVLDAGASAMNSWQANVTVPTCCRIGDAKVTLLWELADSAVDQVPFAGQREVLDRIRELKKELGLPLGHAPFPEA